jgi:hypothetical protein
MTETERPIRQVAIANVNMPFTAMVGLVIKFWIATAVAAVVLAFFGAILLAIFGNLLAVR